MAPPEPESEADALRAALAAKRTEAAELQRRAIEAEVAADAIARELVKADQRVVENVE